MSTPFSIFALVHSILLLAGPPPDAALSAARTQIQAQYGRRATAAIKHDIRGVLDILAPGFSIRTLPGQIATRQAWEQGLRSTFQDMEEQARRSRKAGGEWKNPGQVTTVIQSIKLSGDRAMVTAVTTTRNTARYPAGLTQTATQEETSVDTWVKSALGWRLLLIEQRRNRTTTDEVKTAPAEAARAAR